MCSVSVVTYEIWRACNKVHVQLTDCWDDGQVWYQIDWSSQFCQPDLRPTMVAGRLYIVGRCVDELALAQFWRIA